MPGKRNTVDKIVGVVKTILGEAFNRDDIPSNPMYRVGLVHRRSQRGAFTAKEVQALFPADGLGQWPDQETYTAFFLEKKTILVNRAYKAETNEVGLPKWGRTRTTFMRR